MSSFLGHEQYVNGRINRYLRSDDIEEKALLAFSLANDDLPYAKYCGSEMYFDLAAQQTNDEEDGSGFFTCGVYRLEQLEAGRQKTNIHPDLQTLLATRRAGLNILESLLHKDKMPSLEMVEAQFESLTFSAHQIYMNVASRGSLQDKRLWGAMSEASVLLLLSRFASEEQVDSYFPLRALFSQDRGGGRGPIANRWDVSVITQFGSKEPRKLAHKIQVKTTRSSNRATGYSDRRYCKDIPTVYVRNDLSLQKDVLISPWTIVDECGQETNGQSRLTAILDQRTTRLLDIIG